MGGSQLQLDVVRITKRKDVQTTGIAKSGCTCPLPAVASHPVGLGASSRVEESCRVSRPLIQGKFQEVADIDYAEDEADRRGHGVTALVVEEPRPREVKRLPPRFECASAMCWDIADPIRVGTIGQGDDVAITSPEDVDRGAVLTP